SISTGQAGRPFATITWELIEGGSAAGYAGTPLEAVVAATRSLVLDVPRGGVEDGAWEAFFPPGSYRIKLTLQNWAGGVDSVEQSFTKLNGTAPGLALNLQKETVGAFEQSFTKLNGTAPGLALNLQKETVGAFEQKEAVGAFEQVKVQSIAVRPASCSQTSALATAPLAFLWSVTEVGSGAVVPLSEVLKTTGSLTVPAYSLTPGKVDSTP
ncbi:hypothetical protein T484DRAFT_1792646, partial [Baffinella frigidus]